MKKFLNSTLFFNIKTLFVLSILTKLATAADTVDIGDLNTKLSSGKQLLQFGAKWGGIGVVVAAGLGLASGKLDGQVGEKICKGLIGLGLIMSAFSWFGDSFTNGFAF